MDFICTLAASKAARGKLEGRFYESEDGFLTIGLEYRNPRTRNERMTVSQLLDFIAENDSYWYDAYADSNGCLHVHAYSANDMF